ncbi:F-box/FBD/LRR-repeat protein At5g22660-like [Aegilops tauschii subsp. strangulata]|uniref:F-box/FBD/LRR-repeat protein At5g22660-like n=1 Tax=Aegilops tauschii subsp. strangulata TaxID=200361 RepID=UPI00098B24E4|nr:uncharacterized protein LOC109746941 [Aegilops tauschii subsp. strangulata]XP_044397061.1 uncharacterized protein LOC123121214 [Triticum aestivum]
MELRSGRRLSSLPPRKRNKSLNRRSNIGEDEDMISTLPDHLLLGILERLDLHEALRVGAASTRWQHLPHQLSHLELYVDQFHGATPVEMMDAFTDAARRLLSIYPPACSACSRAIKTLGLSFYMSDPPQLSSIGRVVEDVVSRGETEYLEFHIFPPSSSDTTLLLAELGQRFISFSHACPVAFRWLTVLTLEKLAFGDADIAGLIKACDKLEYLTLISCRLVDHHSALKIDTPCSGLQELWFVGFACKRIELISVPKLRKVWCWSWPCESPPVHFGHVPQLREVSLGSRAGVWQAPFALSECLLGATNLSRLYLNFGCEMIWIQPEHPKHLTTIFRNLTDVYLYCIFPECDLNWTMFIVQAAPALLNFTLYRNQHPCVKTSEHSAQKTNMLWEPSKDWKHPNLKLLVMAGFEEEDKVTNYLRLFIERAVGLKRIELRGKHPCDKCNAMDLELESTRSLVDKASRYRIKERLTHESSLSVKITIC